MLRHFPEVACCLNHKCSDRVLKLYTEMVPVKSHNVCSNLWSRKELCDLTETLYVYHDASPSERFDDCRKTMLAFHLAMASCIVKQFENFACCKHLCPHERKDIFRT